MLQLLAGKGVYSSYIRQLTYPKYYSGSIGFFLSSFSRLAAKTGKKCRYFWHKAANNQSRTFQVADFLHYPCFGANYAQFSMSPYSEGINNEVQAHSDTAVFFCQFNPADQTLSFGASSGILRALVDVGDFNGADMSGGIAVCANSINPDAIHNAPDQQADAQALCKALGYSFGSVESVNTNICPEPHALDSLGSIWDSDFIGSAGFGRTISCAGFQ